jgi:hypothetical protein
MTPMSTLHSTPHPRIAELALYVVDALDWERKEAVEIHVAVCDACAAALAREASVEAAFEQVARLAEERAVAALVAEAAAVISIEAARRQVPAMHAAAARLGGHVSHGSHVSHLPHIPRGRRSRWAGGVGGALAAAAALVLAFASTTARSEPAGVAQRAPGLHDAAGDMSGAFAVGERVPGGEPVLPGESVIVGDTLDGG